MRFYQPRKHRASKRKRRRQVFIVQRDEDRHAGGVVGFRIEKGREGERERTGNGNCPTDCLVASVPLFLYVE